jgi:hypothetical protein
MKELDFDRISRQVADFLSRHKSSLYEIVKQNTNVFETFCFVLFVQYYETVGYKLEPKNLLDGKFRFKYSTRGYPWNYSYFAVSSHESKGGKTHDLFEIRHNQQVSGAWIEVGEGVGEDPPMFALDISVIEAGSLPQLKQGQKRKKENYWVDNANLITFAEAKKLTAYPMLLAQFLGIVHEVKPNFLKLGQKDIHDGHSEPHPPPVLFTSSHLSLGTERVLQSFEARDMRMIVIENVTSVPGRILVGKISEEANKEASEKDLPF